MRLKGRTALVSGGSRGIGAAIVRRLCADGAKVYFTYHASQDEAMKVRSSCAGGEAVAVRCDVRRAEEVSSVVDGMVEKEGRLDVLVNNAGIIRDGLFATLSDEDWREVLETNLGGTYHFCKCAVRPMMMQRKGRIINVSSIVGELGGFGQANYAASKGAVNSLTKSLASELASRGITVNAVAPGMVHTSMSEAVRSAFGDKIKERIPAGKFAEPEDVAGLVAFLASDEAGYITGQIIAVDGGIGLLGRR